jgi:hypothetical protein
LFREPGNIGKSFRISKSELPACPARHGKGDSIGARLAIDGLGSGLYALLYGLKADEVAHWSPASRSESCFVRN